MSSATDLLIQVAILGKLKGELEGELKATKAELERVYEKRDHDEQYLSKADFKKWESDFDEWKKKLEEGINSTLNESRTKTGEALDSLMENTGTLLGKIESSLDGVGKRIYVLEKGK